MMDMMRGFGLGTWFIDLVYQVLSNNWFSVLINGEQANFFKSFRGIRQKDQLSLALFIIVAEHINRKI